MTCWACYVARTITSAKEEPRAELEPRLCGIKCVASSKLTCPPFKSDIPQQHQQHHHQVIPSICKRSPRQKSHRCPPIIGSTSGKKTHSGTLSFLCSSNIRQCNSSSDADTWSESWAFRVSNSNTTRPPHRRCDLDEGQISKAVYKGRDNRIVMCLLSLAVFSPVRCLFDFFLR